MKIVGLCVHGLMGDTYSLGMDALASKLNRATPEGIHFSVEGGNAPDLVAGVLTQLLIKAAQEGSTPMVFGHSMGGDFVWSFASAAARYNITLPLLGSIDPTCWRTNGPDAGHWIAPANVKTALNFRQPYYPGGGYVLAENPKLTRVNEHTYHYAHANFGQALAMDTAPDIHAAIISAVMAVIGGAT